MYYVLIYFIFRNAENPERRKSMGKDTLKAQMIHEHETKLVWKQSNKQKRQRAQRQKLLRK